MDRRDFLRSLGLAGLINAFNSKSLFSQDIQKTEYGSDLIQKVLKEYEKERPLEFVEDYIENDRDYHIGVAKLKEGTEIYYNYHFNSKSFLVHISTPLIYLTENKSEALVEHMDIRVYNGKKYEIFEDEYKLDILNGIKEMFSFKLIEDNNSIVKLEFIHKYKKKDIKKEIFLPTEILNPYKTLYKLILEDLKIK